MPSIAKKKPTPTISRECTLEPLTAQAAFPEDYKNSREDKESQFMFSKIMSIVLNGSNSTFGISDVFGVASTLPISLSSVRSMFDSYIAKSISDKTIKQVPSLFPDEPLYSRY
jgi:hypothetical protein